MVLRILGGGTAIVPLKVILYLKPGDTEQLKSAFTTISDLQRLLTPTRTQIEFSSNEGRVQPDCNLTRLWPSGTVEIVFQSFNIVLRKGVTVNYNDTRYLSSCSAEYLSGRERRLFVDVALVLFCI